MSDYQHLKLERDGAVARLRLNRPEVRNAFDDTVVAELTAAAAELSEDRSVRATVISGEGKLFCAGADINWMQRMVSYTLEENRADSGKLSAMLRALDSIPHPTICRVHRAALGGGVGLLAVCDYVVASDDTVFSLSEVKLGILPAVISPFVLRRLSHGVGRALFLTGERFDAARAYNVGLIDRICPMEKLDETVDDLLQELLSGGSMAHAKIKELIPQVYGRPPAEVAELTAHTNAAARAGAEGQEGLKAFLEKRKPSWIG